MHDETNRKHHFSICLIVNANLNVLPLRATRATAWCYQCYHLVLPELPPTVSVRVLASLW